MTKEKLCKEAVEMLTNKKIIEAEDNWIKLENGWRIYLDECEVEFINSVWEEEDKQKPPQE